MISTRAHESLGDEFTAVTGTSRDKSVELDALAKTNQAKRSGRFFTRYRVSFCFIRGRLEKNTNFEGSLVDALRSFRA